MLGRGQIGQGRGAETTGGVFLDAELYTQIKGAHDPAATAEAWLAIQAGIVAGLRRAVVVSGPGGRGPFRPLATWPKDAGGTRALSGATETAIGTGRLVLQSGGSDDEATVAIAYPISVDGIICGAAAIEIDQVSDDDTRLAMDQLEWGSAWLETLIRRGRVTSSDRLATVIELLATSLHFEQFQAAATAAVTELAGALACERVAIGFLKGKHARLRALSHSAAFGKRANLVRAIEAAMDEAMEQQAVIVHPSPQGETTQVVRAHAALVREHNTGPICTVPLAEGQRLIGALALERPPGQSFDAETVQLCEHVATLLGPVLDIKRKDARWLPQKAWDSLKLHVRRLIGPRHIGLKLAVVAVIAVVAFFSYAETEFRVTADASLQGTVQRTITAPIAGYLAEANVRAGDIVRAGEVIAMLDERDLRLERLKWISQRSKQEREFNEALAKHERAQARILETQIDQANAQIALLDEQLARVRITAPFDGFVVSGDHSQSLGAPLERGDVLFEIAPLDSYRAIIKVDEREIGNIKVGQTGELALTSAPDQPLDVAVEKITPVSVAESGRNYFRVEARLLGGALNQLRPGMQGVAKINIDRRKLIWIWSYKIIHWVRMRIWTWWP